MLYGAADIMVRDVYRERVRMHVRAPQRRRVPDFDLSLDDNLPSYFSSAVEAVDSKNLDYADFQPPHARPHA